MAAATADGITRSHRKHRLQKSHGTLRQCAIGQIEADDNVTGDKLCRRHLSWLKQSSDPGILPVRDERPEEI